MADAPNILFLFPDQLRWDFVGCYGASFALTPSIDRLAAEGVLYERALSVHPVCIPARAALLTGCNALSTGVLTNNYWLRPDHDACGMPTFARLLSDAGWHTEGIGKMHFIPWDISEGFTHRLISEDKRHVHIEDDYHEYLTAKGLRKLRGWDEPGYTEFRMASISPIPAEDQIDVWVGRQAVRFLETYEGDRPWAMMVGFPGPHDPYNPPQEWAERFDPDAMPAPLPATVDTARFAPSLIADHRGGSSRVDLEDFPEAAKRRIRAHYSALIAMIDEQVGRILAALSRRADAERTVVVLAADHGDFVGDFGFLGKSLFFEPAMRVPLIVRQPGGPTGLRCGETVTLTDLFATFLALAGLPHGTGKDSVPLPGLGLPGGGKRELALGATGSGLMVDDGRFRLVRYRNGIATLFDLAEDPQEARNLIRDPTHADRRQALDEALVSAMLPAMLWGHQDKRYPYVTMTPDHPAHKRGWQRPYPGSADVPATCEKSGLETAAAQPSK
jgi:arylsulfatase A-like enzyme